MLEFRADDHSYTWNGTPVPSVTQVIAAGGLMPDLKQWSSQWHMDRGKHVHEATVLIDEGDLDWDALDPEIVGYCRAYERFREETLADLEIVEAETARYHETYHYAGTPDRVALWRGALAVIDGKTGAPAPWHGLQLSAYRALVPDCAVRLGLYLKSDGTWSIKTYADRNEWHVFAAATRLWHWRAAHHLIPKEQKS